MAEIRPFHGVRYRLAQPAEAGNVICPPYDVISPAGAEALRARDPHNVVRLELPEGMGDDRYATGARLFQEWLAAGVLAPDSQPCLYLYGQRYTTEDGPRERLGVLAALKVEPFESGVVLPHEQTFPKHKEDRFRLLTAARAQFSPIFGLYAAPEAGVRAVLDRCAAAPPAAVATDPEGVEHRLWPVSDPAVIAHLAGVLAERPVFIADGHHRYETALRYRGEHADEHAAACVMTFLVEMNDPGLVLFPTHRLVKPPLPPAAELRARFEPYFRLEDVSLAEADALDHHQLGVVLPDGSAWRLTLRDPHALDALDTDHSPAWRDLDVAILHRLVLAELLGITDAHEDIVYTRDPRESRDRVLSGEFSGSFLLPAPQVEELKAVAGAGDRMPEKSTYFWPKAMTGLVIYRVDGETASDAAL
jgi:uncharacterized protein (DUF1015 family)